MAYLTKEACLIINAEDYKLNFLASLASSAAVLAFVQPVRMGHWLQMGEKGSFRRAIQWENWSVSTLKHFSRSITKIMGLLKSMSHKLSGREVSYG